MENNMIDKHKKGWFACIVTRGYEFKVFQELKHIMNDDYWSTYIKDAFLPMKKTTDKKGNEKKVIADAYTGIIYINMFLTQEVYGTIQQIDGFRTPLPAKEPIAISKKEFEKILPYKLDDEEET